MLQSLDEIRAAEMSTGKVINGIDNANLLSVDSTAPFETEVDEVEGEEKKEVEEKEETVSAEEEEKVKSEAAAKESEKDKKPIIDPVQKRFNELTRKWRTAERTIEFEKQKRQALEAEVKRLQATVPDERKPKREDFEDELEYVEALTDWKVEQKFRGKETEVVRAKKEATERAELGEIDERLEVTMGAGREKYEDFDALVLSKDLTITEDMFATILDSDLAEDIAYYLGQNPEVSVEIAKLSAYGAARAIGKIEARLEKGGEGSESAPSPERKPKLTNTPKPIVPLKTKGAIDKDPNTMSMKEYRAWRERNKE